MKGVAQVEARLLCTWQLLCVILLDTLLYVPGGQGRGSCLQLEQLQRMRETELHQMIQVCLPRSHALHVYMFQNVSHTIYMATLSSTHEETRMSCIHMQLPIKLCLRYPSYYTDGRMYEMVDARP